MKKKIKIVSSFSYIFGFIIGGTTCLVIQNYNYLFHTSKQKIISIQDTTIKPRILFHGSPNRSIDILSPKSIRTRKKDDGSVIFATPHIGLATQFMVQWDDSWVKSGSYDHRHYHFICSNKKRFTELDKGGAIYFLPSDNFHSNVTLGLGAGEWITKKLVHPLHKIEFESCLEAMTALGIQVYFVDEKTLNNIKNANDYGKSIVKQLKSENEKLKLNKLSIASR